MASSREFRVILAAATLLAAGGPPLFADADEMTARNDWVKGNLSLLQGAVKTAWGLEVLANHDPVTRNARGGEPLCIAGQKYSRGLYCHAVSKIMVTLPSPEKTFTAVVGVDSNPDTKQGKSSVVFSVTVNGKEAFRSAVLREGMPGVPVSVDLGGATSFTLGIGDAGDGIGWDQSDWADAKVALADGKELWLGDMPMAAAQQAATPPFSFQYGERGSALLLAEWPLKVSSRELEKGRTETTYAWTDAKTGLEVRCVAVEYKDFPTVEWTLHFKNTGSADTEILSKIQALDTTFRRGNQNSLLLRHWDGGYCGPHAYRPHETALNRENENLGFSPDGRGSDRVLPYFNLEHGGGGTIIAVGWPGQWRIDFKNADGKHRVTAGQELTRFRLRPGEEARSPLIVLQFWTRGDWIDAQNVWRRWMIAHNMPTKDGKPLPPQMAGCSSHLFNEMLGANEENQILFVNRHADEGMKLDYWWMDAGWYPNKGGWPNTGTWEVDPKRFPRGLRAISDVAHGRGVKVIVWFEPERVTPGTWIWEKHPEWLIGKDGGNRLLNLGLPEARQWLADHVDRTLKEQGIDLYRQDFNINPLGLWRSCDAPDRQGLTEIHYNVGYLAYWDELRRRHPGMLIDSCASGGRRNDLETMRRSVPLLRSDDIGVPINEQGHSYGFSFWVPYQGTGTGPDPYGFRSCMNWHMTVGPDARKKDAGYELWVRMATQWRQVAENFHGDYYPLTPYSLSEHSWMAWQFNRPEAGAGMVQAFRRARCEDTEQRFRLRGLDPEAAYEFTNFDKEGTVRLAGRALMKEGLPVTLPDPRSAALIAYKRVDR